MEKENTQQEQAHMLTPQEQYGLFMERRALHAEGYEIAANRLYDLENLTHSPTVPEMDEINTCLEIILSFEREFGEEATVDLEDHLNNRRIMGKSAIERRKEMVNPLKDTQKMEKSNTRLSNLQINALRDVGNIRDKNRENSHNRLANFEKNESTTKEVPVEDPIVNEGQIVYINGQQITTGQDFVSALGDAYGNHPELYGFEDYENEVHEMPKSDIESRDDASGLER